jgi:hypothetical protein
MAKSKLSSVLVLLIAVTQLNACGEPEETCTCACACGSGAETSIEDAESDEDCSSKCDVNCGDDSYTTNYDCTTKG